jgi:CBS domain-containing protein
MNTDVLTVTPERTLREAGQTMAERNCGSMVVIDPEAPGPGIVKERDLMRSIGGGQDPDREVVADHVTPEGTFAAPDWSLERASGRC